MKLYKSKTWIGWKNHNEVNSSAQHLCRRQQNWVTTSNFCTNSTKYRLNSLFRSSIPKCGVRITTQKQLHLNESYTSCVHCIRCYLQFPRKSISMISFSEPRNSFLSCLSNANRANVLHSCLFLRLYAISYLSQSIWLGLIWFRLKYVWYILTWADTQEIHYVCWRTCIRMNWNL